MATPTNILQTVQTYQRSGLAYLQNINAFIGGLCNTKFKNFENLTANLGSSVTFDLPPRFTTAQGLVAQFQPAAQRVQTLTCSQSANTSFAFTAQQLIFNVEKDSENYVPEFVKSAVQELSAQIEIDVAKNVISGVTNQTTGALDSTSGPYRFYGDGVTAINSYQQLAQMVANFKNYGSVKEGIKVCLPDLIVPQVIGSGLAQFAPKRNDEDAMSWEIGEFGTPPVHYYQSNELPIHVAGNVGVNGTTLTLVSTNDPTGQNVTQLTFSGAGASDSNAIFSGDLLQFQDGVSGKPNMRYLTFIGHGVSGQPVQFRATADAGASAGGNVVINVFPALVWAAGANQNLNNPLQAGMTVKALPSHRAGVVIGGNALYLALPQLPDQSPFATANEYDENTAVSLRMTHGSEFGQNQTGIIVDATWGSVLVPEYAMRVVFPLSQA